MECLSELSFSLRMAVSEQNLELLPDYQQRIAVLQDLNFLDENSTVLLKGRVACEINTGHELILTELILDNFFAGYEPQEAVALLSCFVFQERRLDTEPVLTDRLVEVSVGLSTYSSTDYQSRVANISKI